MTEERKNSGEPFENERSTEKIVSSENMFSEKPTLEDIQWKGEVKVGLPEFTEEEKKHVGQEMSDVLIYLVRLADRCKIDLPAAVLQKFEQNRHKYPAKKVYGKSDKYTAYE
ncbi:Hypothetical predicted protein [Mytilus galloprovincialis]|uniref:dCTP pyrophosphatase 1 n=1 Tax=Mytilus galloprovincialis TaxID=29158 RepID=A0A8B6BJI2_MYTGA|nr:Hypothetical predicted protein [Mytilus galloprovincialis]